MRYSFLAALLTVATAQFLSAQSVPQNVLYPDLSGEALMNQIRAAYKPATVYSYNTARDSMFARVYNVGGVVTCVYTGDTIAIPFASSAPRTIANNHTPQWNTEHVFPQSMGALFGNGNSDMHHLMPVRSDVNSSRSNTLFGVVPTANVTKWWGENGSVTSTPAGDLSVWSRVQGASAFEPRNASKGNIARAAFYFYTMYTTETTTSDDPLFFSKMREALRDFHAADPVDALEFSRTQHIARMQGNKPNPFIIDTTLVRRIFFTGTFTPPPPNPGGPQTLTFTFEDASKISYALGSVTTNGIGWSLSEALIGSDVSGDMKRSTKSIRFRHSQTVTTFAEIVTNREHGIGQVSFLVARSNFADDRTGIAPVLVLEVWTEGVWVQVGESISLAGVDALTAVTRDVQEPGPSRIRIRSISGDSGKRFNVDDIVITPYAEETVDLTLSISNQPGWRLISSPVATTYAAFLAPVWTQGASGSDAPGAAANVFRYVGSTFVPVTQFADSLQRGDAFAFAHFNDDNDDGVPNAGPTLLDVSGTKPAGVFTLIAPPADSTRYVLAGNPFSGSMHFDDVIKSDGALDIIQVWDPTEQRYWARSYGVGDFDGRIAPFQGFWVRAAASGRFRFDRSAVTSGSIFYGKDIDPPVIIITICEYSDGHITECDSLYRDVSYLAFHPDASEGLDLMDAPKLPSLVEGRVSLSTVVEGRNHHIQFVSTDVLEAVDIPLQITAGEGSTVVITLSGSMIPADVVFTKCDETDKCSQNVNETGHKIITIRDFSTKYSQSVTIRPLESTSSESRHPNMGIGFQLAQNYPNPFNPTTVINFTVGTQDIVSRSVRLSVYDLLGREVSVLVNGAMSAGSHSVTFDASNLPSGVYMVKLEAGAQSMTRRMTLLK